MATFRTSAAGGSSSGTGNRTCTITPAVGDLLVVYCFVSTNTNDTPTCSDNNNGGGVYTLIDVANVSISAIDHRLSVFVRNALMTNTTSTVVTVATGSNTSGAVHVHAFSGMMRTGSSAVRSKGLQNNQAAGVAAPVLNQNALTGNVTIVAHGSGDTTTTAPTGWTERQDTNFTAPVIALETATRDSGFANTTITFGAASSTTFCSHALELDGSENVTMDKWRTSAAIPPLKAKTLVASLIPTLFFVPVMEAPSTAVYVAGASCEPIAVQNFQYPSIAFVPIVQPEIPTAWNCNLEQPIFKQKRIIDTDARPQVITAPSTAVFINGQSPEPISLVHFQYEDKTEPLVTLTAPETITSDKWHRPTEKPIFKPKRLIQYGTNIAIASERIYWDAITPQISQPTFLPKRRWSEIVGSPSPVVAAEQNILTKWSQPTQLPVRLRPRIQDTTGNVHFLGTLKERATPDKWEYISPQPTRLPARRQGESVSSPAPVVQAEVISLDKWVRETERPQFRQTRVITETVKPLVPIVPSETVTTDKWTVAAELPRQRLLRRQDANGDLTFIVVTVPKPLEQTAEPVRQAKRLTLTGVEPPRIEDQIPESWRQETQSPITRAIQRVYESAQPLLRDFAETVSLDRFYLNQNEPRWDVKRWQHLYPTFVADTKLYADPIIPGAPAAEDRTFRVPHEDRFYDVPSEDRYYRVPAEVRFLEVE